MSTLTHSVHAARGDRLFYHASFTALYPVCLLVEATRRALARLAGGERERSARPLFAEARDIAQIAISYVFMA